MKKLCSIIALLLVLFISCKKGQTGKESQEVPSEVITSGIQSPDPTRLILSGSIKKGSKSITEYGFIYGKSAGQADEKGTKVPLGNSFEGGNFTKEITGLDAMGDKPIIYTRAYFIDQSGITYGNELSTEQSVFRQGTLSPSYGKTEDQVAIQGKFYSPVKSDITVTFGNVQAQVLSVSDTEISVKVPKGIPAAHGEKVTVDVVNRGVKTEMTKDFEIFAHILDFSPKEGALGSYISLTGDNLPNDPVSSYNIAFYFGDVKTQTGALPSFRAAVPIEIPTEKIPLYVSIKDVKIKLPGEFTALKPVITNIIPKSGPPGTRYTVTGLNLPYVSGSSSFLSGKLGGKTADLVTYSEDLLYFTSAIDAAPGEQAFTLSAGPFMIVTDQKVNVLPHQITDVQPRSGYITGNFRIKGTFVSGHTGYFVKSGHLFRAKLTT